MESSTTIAVIGLGYVGLPLAVEFGKKYFTLGFDVNRSRVLDLQAGVDRTREVGHDDINHAERLTLTSDPRDLRGRDVYVITVPTPIDRHNRPDLEALRRASVTVGHAMSRGATVIYESTVYPGATEEVCLPILEAESGLRLGEDFSLGYSPERVNPGDKGHRIQDIRKVISGSSPESSQFIDCLYSSIITAGTYRAPSIKVAEAAKVIENTQRDLNIALVNELALLFHKLGLDTRAVLAAAGSKWNFMPFQPGLVGGHCIGVDPYYLTHKAQEVGYHPEIILAGRRINDGMGSYVADRLVLSMARKGIPIGRSQVLILGLSFKENCPDFRNTRVVDIIKRLGEYGVTVGVTDAWVDPTDAKQELEIELLDIDSVVPGRYHAAVLAVAHDAYSGLGAQLRKLVGHEGVILDVKGVLDPVFVDDRL